MMKTIYSFLFILIMNSIFFTILIHSQINFSEPIEIPFTLTEEGHKVMSATVNGVAGNFIFDTGAGLDMLTKKFADSIPYLKKTDGFYTGHRATGEELQVDLWEAKQFKLGSFMLEDALFSVFDVEFPLDGLISLIPFKETPITIDYKNKILIIESDLSMKERIKQAGTPIPIQITKDRDKTLSISSYIHLDNKLKLQVRLDSGAGFDVYRFNSRYMKPLNINSTQVRSEYRASDFKPDKGNNYYYAHLSEMTIVGGKREVKNFEATFIDGLIYEGIMSLNWLGDKITIDVPGKRLFVE